MIRLSALCLLCSALSLSAASAPIEVWLTPARAAQLQRITSRPYITAQERQPDGTVVYHWTNGLHGAVTTQRVQRVLGAPAKSAWRDKLDKAEKEKQQIISDLRALGGKTTLSKKDVDAVIKKHEAGAETKGKR